MEQIILSSENNYESIDKYLLSNKVKSLFVVRSASFDSFPISSYFYNLEKRLGIKIIYFYDFHSNPDYSSVVKGEQLFRESKCDCIAAIGGGSSIDVAKCIKLYFGLDSSKNYLHQIPIPNTIPFFVAPTTAGTGSEATKYAVIYYNGEKQSITHETCIPSAVLFDPTVLHTLPVYQRKATMLDAFCHAIEAFWSINSTKESKAYSKQAIKLILKNLDIYLANELEGNKNMLMAANIAGKAINITQTTAGHAMCYKLTSQYGIAHGHAAALCVGELWSYMIDHTEDCIEKRGKNYLTHVFADLAETMNVKSPHDAAIKFKEIVLSLDLPKIVAKDDDFEILSKSVNPIRLKNNPIALKESTINILYHKILEQ